MFLLFSQVKGLVMGWSPIRGLS